MSFLHEREQYLRPTSDIIPKMAVRGTEMLLYLLTDMIYIKGKENIPTDEAYVALFASHAGEAEPTLIDIATQIAIGKKLAWLTALSHYEEVPKVFRKGRLTPVDRKKYDETAMIPLIELIAKGFSVGTSIEGTRTLLNKDFKTITKDVLRQLNKPKRGIITLTKKSECAILPIATANTEEIYPFLEKTIEELGLLGFAIDAFKRIIDFENKPDLYVSFCPPYTAHLEDGDWSSIRGGEIIFPRLHGHIIMLDHIIPELQKIDPNYPLNYYANLSVEKYYQRLENLRSEIRKQTKFQ